jgi:hypothetical protein
VRPKEVLVATLAPERLATPQFDAWSLAAASSDFGLRSGNRVYAPGGAFVVDNGTRAAPSLAVCDAAGCAPLPLPAAPAWLLVDHPKRVAYYLHRASTAAVEIEIRRIEY